MTCGLLLRAATMRRRMFSSRRKRKGPSESADGLTSFLAVRGSQRAIEASPIILEPSRHTSWRHQQGQLLEYRFPSKRQQMQMLMHFPKGSDQPSGHALRLLVVTQGAV